MMKITPKFGYEKLLFGMRQQDVEAVYGKPSLQFEDEDKNVIYLYNDLRARLTFYEEEDFRLGYLIVSHPEAVLYGHVVRGSALQEVQEVLKKKGIVKWEQEQYDSTITYFNEDYWLLLQSEFDVVTKVELGAVIKNADEFDWKF
jgi:hypothetical protein